MSDLLLELGPDGADLVVEGDDLARDEGLKTAVLVSILSDARAAGAVSPTTLEIDTRGWWADSIRDRFGSRLWTLEREKRTTATLERARELGRDALAWLIQDGIAARVEVEASYDVHGHLRLAVDIYRGDSTRHGLLWHGTQAVRVELLPDLPTEPIALAPDQNVVLFLFDDGGIEYFDWSGVLEPFAGHATTPRMNEMRARGVTFRRAYATSVCGPTRACVQLGRHGFRTGMGGNLDGVGATGFGVGLYDGVQTELLVSRALRLGRDGTSDQSLGQLAFTYASGWFGKGHIFSDAGMEAYPVEHGWGRYAGCQPNAGALENWGVGQLEPYEPGDPEYVAPHGNGGHFHFREITVSHGGAITHETYGAEGIWPAGGPYVAWNPTVSPRAAWDGYKVFRDAMSWINTRTQPFFAMVCMNPPHAPFETPPYTYPDTVGVGATGLTRDLIAPATQTLMSLFNNGAGGPGFQAQDANRMRQVYRANIEAIDTLIGLFWDRMDPAKRDRTVFLFMGDNGTVAQAVDTPYNPGHGKRTMFEQGMRVPCFAWGSTDVIKTPGRFCDHLVHSVDLFSTVLDITGCDPQRWNPGGAIKIDGKSLFPVLHNAAAPPARTFIYNELFLPIGGQLDGDPLGTPSIPTIIANQWTQAYNDGTYKLHRRPPGANPPYFMFKIDGAAQPASGEPGYLELAEDDLYPLAVDGLHPDIADKFQELLAALNEFLET